jgi:murein endopeptidase
MTWRILSAVVVLAALGVSHEAVSEHPLSHLSDAELEGLLVEDRAALGPVSLGQPDAGQLWNAVKMPEGERWHLVDPPRAWATPETIGYLTAAIDKVHEQFPKTQKIYIGDLSREGGGRFGQHISHRTGRDVDLGFYYKKRFTRWYTAGTEENLDLPRTWALLKALVTETDVELILLDRDLQWLLRSHARQIGEDRAWIRSLFVKRPPPVESPLVQNQKGHKTHFHVRFYNPIAQETGRRIYPLAVKHKLFKARHFYVSGWAKRGETFEGFLRRYRTSRASFQKANGARRFRPGSSFKILRYGPVDPGEGPLIIPPRMLPPAKADAATQRR